MPVHDAALAAMMARMQAMEVENARMKTEKAEMKEEAERQAAKAERQATRAKTNIARLNADKTRLVGEKTEALQQVAHTREQIAKSDVHVVELQHQVDVDCRGKVSASVSSSSSLLSSSSSTTTSPSVVMPSPGDVTFRFMLVLLWYDKGQVLATGEETLAIRRLVPTVCGRCLSSSQIAVLAGRRRWSPPVVFAFWGGALVVYEGKRRRLGFRTLSRTRWRIVPHTA